MCSKISDNVQIICQTCVKLLFYEYAVTRIVCLSCSTTMHAVKWKMLVNGVVDVSHLSQHPATSQWHCKWIRTIASVIINWHFGFYRASACLCIHSAILLWQICASVRLSVCHTLVLNRNDNNGRLYLKKDIEMLEKVQKRATRLMFRDKSSSFGERLQQSGLTTLEIRRLHGDLIEMFKIFKCFTFDDINYQKNFTLSSTQLRGHDFKLYKPQVTSQSGC